MFTSSADLSALTASHPDDRDSALAAAVTASTAHVSHVIASLTDAASAAASAVRLALAASRLPTSPTTPIDATAHAAATAPPHATQRRQRPPSNSAWASSMVSYTNAGIINDY